jgi:D-alanyl-D-alanine carboxypeptidase
MNDRKITLLVFLIGISLIGLTAQQGTSSLRASLQHTLDSIVRADQLPGLTYAVALPDGACLSLSAGYSDRENFQKMQPSSQMLVGSTGKTFVAALVLIQVEAGLLHLDAHLEDYFGGEAWFEALPNHEQITVRMLLQHTSGLPRYVFSPTFKKALNRQPERSWKPQELLGMVGHQKAVHPAGKGWAYSDTNYLLLGLLLEKINGKSYYALLQEKILNPLKLDATLPSDQQALPTLTQGYIGSQDILGLGVKKTMEDGRYAVNPQFEWTGGGLLSSSADLARWMYALHSGSVINLRLLQELRLAVSFKNGVPSRAGYGLGTFVWQLEDGTLHYGHEGIMPGYVTSIEYAADLNMGMAIQLNTDEGLTTRLHAYQLLLKEVIAQQMEADSTLRLPADQN